MLAAPHRLAFFLAGLMLALSAVWWLVLLLMRALNTPVPLTLPIATAHGLLMSLGFMPLFFAGFLFTAGPKWLRRPEVPARSLLPSAAAMVLGWIGVLFGFHLQRLLAGSGTALVALGWTILSFKFWALLRRSNEADRTHAAAVSVTCGVGTLALWSAALALALNSLPLLETAVQLGLWGFVAPTFVIASHRMIPFFGSSAAPALDARWPLWLLWTLLCSLGLEGLLGLPELWNWPPPQALRWAQLALELPSALLLLWLSWRWSRIQNLSIRLLAMLHGGFTWLGIAFALSALSHLLQGLTDNALSLGLAPLHALTMGYLGATMLAMTTRISTGHGGRAVTADNVAWTLYWLLQLAVVLRVGAALWPAAGTGLTLLAIFFWTATAIGWATRYGRWFGRARPDGRPG